MVRGPENEHARAAEWLGLVPGMQKAETGLTCLWCRCSCTPTPRLARNTSTPRVCV